MESVREAGEEIKSNQIGDNEGDKQGDGGMVPESVGGLGGFCGHFRGGGATVEEFARKNLGAESDEETENSKSDTDKAGLKEEGEGFVLDNFFRRSDNIGRFRMHGSAGATEADTEEDARGSEVGREKTSGVFSTSGTSTAEFERGMARGGEPGLDGDSIKIETDVRRLGDITFENGVFKSFLGLGFGSFHMVFHGFIHSFGDLFHGFLVIFHRFWRVLHWFSTIWSGIIHRIRGVFHRRVY